MLRVRTRVRALNTEVASAVQANNAVLYDLNSRFRRIRTDGLLVGTRVQTADYLGGFYSLNGFYPGITGHAVIANDLLSLINTTYGRSYPLVGVTAASVGDPAIRRIQSAPKQVPVERSTEEK